MGWKKHFSLLLVVLLFVGSDLLGQKIRFYSSEEGLPNSLINKVSQDQRGFIWIATDNGASYFDGMRFTTFRHEKGKSGTISSDLVKSFYTDSKGTCWVGTSNGLQYFDYENNLFCNFPIDKWDYKGSIYISAIIESPDREVLLVSLSGIGIVVIQVASQEIDVKSTETLKELYGTTYLGGLFFDSKGYLWSFSEQGNFFRCDLKANEIKKPTWSNKLKEVSNSVVVSSLTEDPATGNLLIGTHNHGLFVFDRALGIIRNTKGRSASKYRIRTLLTETKQTGSFANVWIGTEDHGLRRFDWHTEEIVSSGLQYAHVDLENCKVHALLQDNQGNIWVGIFQKGLLVIPKSTYGFEYIKLSANPGLLNVNIASVKAITRDASGYMWIGTDGGGLFRISNDGQITRFTEDNTQLPNNSIMTLAVDKRGTLWISTYMGGITTYNEKTGFNTFSTDVELQKVNSSWYNREQDKLYCGTLGYGVMVISFSDNKIQRFPADSVTSWISALCLDRDNNLWVGRSDGVRCYHTVTGEEKFRDVAERTNNIRLCSFLEDNNGSIWIGSSDGLMNYQKETGKLSSYTKKDGLPSNLIASIQQDSNGILWLSTNKGLARFDPLTGISKNFYAYDGLQDNEFSIETSFLDSDGKMLFGGINGITAFYPKKVDSWKQTMSKLNFTRFTVFNKAVNYDKSLGKRNVLDSHISQAKKITLRKGQNVFSLEFAVMEYTNPQKVVYGYMLKGFDNNWQYTDSRQRTATYTNLPDGHYTFRVKAFFEGSPEEEDTVYNEIQIRILPPWYKTWWAYLIYLVVFMGFVSLAADFLIRRRLRRQEQAEFAKKEMRIRMFTDLSHEIRTPLTLVMNPLKSMRESEPDPKRREMFNLMYRNVLRILRLLNQLMDIRKIDNHQLKMNFSQTNLIYFTEDIMKSFEPLAILRNIDFRLITNLDKLDVWIDQANFDKVLYNILSNAFKYTPDLGSIHLSINKIATHRDSGLGSNAPEYVAIRIENSGSRMDETELERIFERFYQVNNDTVSGTGIGLNLAKMIVRLHHGLINASNVENGVAFQIEIPLDNKHLTEEELKSSELHKDLYSQVRADEKMPNQAEYIEIPDTGEDKIIKASKLKRTIVFVDDDADLCRFIRMELSEKYNIEICYDGKEAWKVISGSMPDAVITDLVMPEVDGMALCRKIRQNPQTNHIPVIILTSQTDEESEQQCIECGADNFLTKPVSIDLLKGTVAQMIQTRDTIRNKFRSNTNPDFETIQMNSPDNRLVAKVIETIRKNIENPEFSVDDLSREVGLSRVHLNRKLKENVNISPSSLIKSIRLKQAAYLLIKHKVNISEVAYKVGFTSHSYFSNNFREYFGIPPSEFVSKYINSDDKETLEKLFGN